MPFVIAEPCIGEKDKSCVEVCPVNCIYEGEDQFYIHPDECIDCTLCVAECPVEAIYAEDDVPAEQSSFIALNAELAKHWKPIIARKEPSPDADQWQKVKDKLGLLER